MNLRTSIAACALAVAAAALSGPASADLVLRDYTINAAGNCQPALPVFSTNFRQRPLGIKNEGTTPAYVTCSLPGDFITAGNNFAGIGFVNTGAADYDVSCTFTDGVAAPFSTPNYYPQTVTVPAGSANAAIWDPAAFALTTFSQYANFSCLLPPGGEINLLEIQFEQDNGVAPPPARTGRATR
jgi:hypothetical protein